MIVSGTGHRPDKLGGYDVATFNRLVDLATAWLKANRPSLVISGMALGWDQALAKAAIDLGIPVHAYVPFIGQADKWPKRSCEEYSKLLLQCTETKVICPGSYSPEKMQIRNERMVDACDLVLALWDGSSGGTANCVTYAEFDAMKPVTNLWPQYEELLAFS